MSDAPTPAGELVMSIQEFKLAAIRFVESVGNGTIRSVNISDFAHDYAQHYAASANSAYAHEGRRLLIHALHITAEKTHIAADLVEVADRMINEHAQWLFQPRSERVVDRINTIAPNLLR